MIRILIQQAVNHTRQQTRQYARAHRYRPNPGIRRQNIAETNEIVSDSPDSSQWDDDLDKFEADFSDTRDTYEQYRQETKSEGENLRHKIVRDKYFNEKKLSFLTWAEMEQIRKLHVDDPEEWNLQKLSESFPADEMTIKKIVKRKWQPKDSKRIDKYDEIVRSNWKSFINGEIDLDPMFSKHLMKFSQRNLNIKNNYDNILKKELPKPKRTEFLSIITSCKNYKEEPKQISSSQTLKIPSNLEDESKIEDFESERPKRSERIVSRKLYTFKQSTTNTEVSVGREAEVIFDNPSGTGIKKQIESNEKKASVNPFDTSKYKNDEIQLDQRDLKELSRPSIREHIDIPLHLFKEGATYRLDDCYYDDDGELLYRVPGMTGL